MKSRKINKKLRRSRNKRRYKKVQYGGEKCLINYFTISTKNHEGLTRLKNSATKNGFDLKILGLEMNDDSFGWQTGDANNKNYGEFSWKLKNQKEYINKFNDDDILLFTDAWDVIVIDSCKKLYDTFMIFNKDIMFGAEKACSPDKERVTEYNDEEKSKPFPYLNSGFFIGKAGAMKKHLKTFDNNEKDDQRFWTTIYFANRDTIGLDHNAELVLNGYDTKNEYYTFNTDGKFIYKETNTSPSFIHGNGPAKDKLSFFIKNN